MTFAIWAVVIVLASRRCAAGVPFAIQRQNRCGEAAPMRAAAFDGTPQRLPAVASRLRDGRWTREAESELLASGGAPRP